MSEGMKFRKRPVVVEAFRWRGERYGEPDQYRDDWPEWLLEAVENCEAAYTFDCGRQLLIRTPEGETSASPGDWIIRGVQGELYPCKPDIFEETYEAVGDDE